MNSTKSTSQVVSPPATKISQIILLNNNYQQHIKNLTQIKSLVDTSTSKRNHNIQDYMHRKSQYRGVRKSMHEQVLQRQNQKILGRLDDIVRRGTSSRISDRSSSSKSSAGILLAQHTARKTFLQSKQLQKQNKLMNERIKNSHSKNRLSPDSYIMIQRQNSNYKKVHSRFSERSKNEMKAIFDCLKMDQKNLPFLPVLDSKRYTKL